MKGLSGNHLVDMFQDNSRPTNLEFCYACKMQFHIDELSEDCLCESCEKKAIQDRAEFDLKDYLENEGDNA